MATQSQVLELLTAAKRYNINKQADKLALRKIGNNSACSGCCDKGLSCLLLVLETLQWQYDAGVFNGTTDVLYGAVLAIIGNSYVPEPTTSQVEWTFTDTDPSEVLADLDFLFNKDFESAATSLTADFTESANQKYLVLKVPTSQFPFIGWGNVSPNEGSIPDFVWAIVTIGGFDYYYTRNTFSLSPDSSTITLSK